MGIGIDRTGLTQFFWRYDLRRPWAPILRCLKGQAGMASRHFGHENTTADDIYTKSPSPLGERRSNTNSGFCIVLKQETCPGTQTHSHTHLYTSNLPRSSTIPLLLFCPAGPGIRVFSALHFLASTLLWECCASGTTL